MNRDEHLALEIGIKLGIMLKDEEEVKKFIEGFS